ncbi:MAG: 50S ribosomal protein L5 [Deltaproteobacteria bacterium]|nr:50S ribosomal protein L5 [Deltaproteobacteria bacterium]
MSFEQFYKEKCLPELQKELGIQNRMRVPRLLKVVLSTCLKEAIEDKKILDRAAEEMALISGQKPEITRARKSIANFKLRQGMPIGCRVVLRKKMMYEFLNRFINVALPRMRDFHGISPKGFDGRGNYTVGITEQIVFPEIDYDKIEKVWGMNVTIVTTARNDAEAKGLLSLLGIPFREN